MSGLVVCCLAMPDPVFGCQFNTESFPHPGRSLLNNVHINMSSGSLCQTNNANLISKRITDHCHDAVAENHHGGGHDFKDIDQDCVCEYWDIGHLENIDQSRLWWWRLGNPGKPKPGQLLPLQMFSDISNPCISEYRTKGQVLVQSTSYILKARVLEVRTPQIIWIFCKIIVWKCKNYQLCSIEFCHKEQKL